MNRLHLLALFIEQPLHMHQATGIVGDNIFRSGLRGRRAFYFAHGGRNHRKLCRERPAEPATGFGVAHFDEFELAHLGEQIARGLFISQLAQTMAAIVKSNLGRKPRA